MLQVRMLYIDTPIRSYSMPSRRNAARPLDCWKEVDRFKNSVAKLEQVQPLIVPLFRSFLTVPTGILQDPTIIH